MASRLFNPPEGALEQRVAELFCKIDIGASGAVSASSGKGIASVVKESADGQYTIRLSDNYPALLWAGITLADDTDSDPAASGVLFRMQSQAVSSATPTVVIQAFAADDGADANPVSGASIYVMLKLRNSTI